MHSPQLCDSARRERAGIDLSPGLHPSYVTEMKAKYSPASMRVVDSTPTPSDLKVTVLQLVFAFVAALQLLAPGMALGYSAVALPQLRNETSFNPLTEEQGSWFASISSISTPVGCLLAGWILDRWGRKVALVLLNLPGLAGWGLLVIANGLIPLFAGRVLTGLALGMASVTSNVYLGEISTPKLRGALMCWNSLSVALGILCIYIFGWVLPWHLAASCALVITSLSLISTFFAPESSNWLLSRSRPDDAEKALVRLRGGGGPAVRAELEQLTAAREKLMMANQDQESGLRRLCRNLRKPEFWKPLLIMNLFFAFQQFAGIYVVIFYAVDMVASVDGQRSPKDGPVMDKYLAAVLIGVARLSVSIAVCFVMRVCGRRPMAIVSGIGMSLCMLTLTIYCAFFLDTPSIIPIISLIAFIVTSTIGFMTLPWAMLGEMFPAQLRGAGGGITTCVAYLLSFAVIKAYPSMEHTLKPMGVFAVYLFFSVAGTIFVAKWLPETAGRTLQDIEASFAGKKAESPREIQPLNTSEQP